MQIADLHCHYPMRLLTEKTRRDPALKAMIKVRKRPRWDKLKAMALKIAARAFNFRRLCDTWRVDLDRLAQGQVKLVFSVLYLPDAEMNTKDWPNGSPNDDYYGELIKLIETVNESIEGDGTPAQKKVWWSKRQRISNPVPATTSPASPTASRAVSTSVEPPTK